MYWIPYFLKPCIFLYLYIFTSFLFGMGLVYLNSIFNTNIANELVFLLIPPVFYCTYRHPTRFYLLQLVTVAVIYAWVTIEIHEPAPIPLPFILVFFFLILLSTELMYQIGKNNRVIGDVNHTLEEKNRILEKEIKIRERFEKDLQESEDRLRYIYDHVQDIIFTGSLDGRILSLSPAFERMTGWPVQEWIGKTYLELFHPDDLPEILENQKRLHHGIQPSSPVIRHRIKSGDYRFYEFRVSPRIENEQIIGYIGTARDVTDREQIVRELRDALAHVHILSGLIPICSACKKIRDDQGYWNQLEEYLQDHSDMEFTHSFCPECAQKYYAKYLKSDPSSSK